MNQDERTRPDRRVLAHLAILQTSHIFRWLPVCSYANSLSARRGGDCEIMELWNYPLRNGNCALSTRHSIPISHWLFPQLHNPSTVSRTMFPRRACASQDGCSIDNLSAGYKRGVLVIATRRTPLYSPKGKGKWRCSRLDRQTHSRQQASALPGSGAAARSPSQTSPGPSRP